jgi:hypothetical protein
VVKYIQENNVDCEHWTGDTLDVPITPGAAESAKKVYEAYKAAGGKVDHIKVTHDPKRAAEVSKTIHPQIFLMRMTDPSIDIANQRRTSLLCVAGINATPLEACCTCYA